MYNGSRVAGDPFRATQFTQHSGTDCFRRRLG
jgi:hypothetical protein